jgi:uncharacterized membrane protein
VQIEIHEAIAKMPGRPLDNAGRLRSVAECFDVYAKAFLRLVSDMQSQNGFIALLHEWADAVRYWQHEGYRRLAVLHKESQAATKAAKKPSNVILAASTEAVPEQPQSSPSARKEPLPEGPADSPRSIIDEFCIRQG